MIYTVFSTALGLLSGLYLSMVSETTDVGGPVALVNPGVAHGEVDTSVCSANVLPYERLRTLRRPVRSLQIKGEDGGQLYYFGVFHTNNPNHPQFERLVNQFNETQPTIVFYEGPWRSLPTDPKQVIPRTGEAGFVQYLAQQSHIPTASLEPSRQDEINAMLQQFSPEQVKLFYVLRQVAELRDRWHLTSETELRNAVMSILDRFSAYDGLKTSITNVDELETWYRYYWEQPAEWWQAPSIWFNPVLTISETGGEFTNDLHRQASTFRNQHMVEILANAVNQGHRVMAVVGHSHIPLQASALHCAIKPS